MDDFLVTGSCAAEIEQFKENMKQIFDMTNLGKLGYFLRMEFLSTLGGMILHQFKHASEIFPKLNMLGCNTVVTSADINLKLVDSGEGKEDKVNVITTR